MKHLLKDSLDLSEQIKTLKISPGSKLVKIDIKDYFMSGDQSELPRLCANHVIDYRQAIFSKVCEWILDHQYVELHGDDRHVYKVIKGSGMGLECPGDVNDLCFYEMAEKNYALDPEIREKYFVEFYARFRDDIIVVLAGILGLGRSFCMV